MAITKAQVRKRLLSAKTAAEQLEADVRWLAGNRAWEVLGHKDFATMWREENGFESPLISRVIAVISFYEEGMRERGVGNRDRTATGHTIADVAEAVGFPVRTSSTGYRHSSQVSAILTQVRAGVPPQKISTSGSRAARIKVEEDPNSYKRAYRARSQPRRMGKLPNELINVGWSVYKYQADAVKEVARKAGVPDSVVVRSALDAYLQGKIGRVS